MRRTIFSPEEEQYIRDNHEKYTIFEMSAYLGYSKPTIISFCNRNNITCYSRKADLPFIRQFIKENYNRLGTFEMSRKLDVTYNSLLYTMRRMSELGEIDFNARAKYKKEKNRTLTLQLFGDIPFELIGRAITAIGDMGRSLSFSTMRGDISVQRIKSNTLRIKLVEAR